MRQIVINHISTVIVYVKVVFKYIELDNLSTSQMYCNNEFWAQIAEDKSSNGTTYIILDDIVLVFYLSATIVTET